MLGTVTSFIDSDYGNKKAYLLRKTFRSYIITYYVEKAWFIGIIALPDESPNCDVQ